MIGTLEAENRRLRKALAVAEIEREILKYKAPLGRSSEI